MQEIRIVVWNHRIQAAAIKLFRQLAFKITQDAHAFPNHIRRYLIRHRGGGGSVAATEREHMHFHKAGLAAGFQRLFEFRICLTGKTDDNVRAEGWIVAEHIADLIESCQESLNTIPTAHAGQHRVTTALQSRMELWAKVFAVSGSFDKLVVDFDSFDAGQPHPPFAGDPIEPPQQVPQPLGLISRLQIVCIDTEVPHVNPADHNLTIPMFNQRADLVFNINGPTTAKSGTNCRDNAVGALQNAAVLDLYESSLMSFELTDPVWHVHDAEAAQHIRKFSFVSHDLDHIRQFRNRVRIARGIAAHDDRLRARILPR